MSLLSRGISKPIKYVERKAAGVKQTIENEVADKVRNIIIAVALGVLMLFVVLFASIGLAAFFNVLLESTVAGFFMVAGIYLLLFIILFVVRRHNYILRKLRMFGDYFMRKMN